MKERYAKFLVIVFLLGGGGFVGFYGWNNTSVRELLSREGLVVHGRVVDHSIGQYSRRSSSYSLTVKFSPTNQPEMTKTFTVDGKAYRPAVKSGVAEVRYLPGNPEIAVADEAELLPFQICLWLGCAMFGAGVFLVGLTVHHAVRGRPGEIARG